MSRLSRALVGSKTDARLHTAVSLTIQARELAQEADQAAENLRRKDVRLSALDTLAEAQEQLEQAKAGIVAALRTEGATWADVAGALGVTRQAAQQRYR